MPSIIEGYNYDIFISYRQKDNKHDGWVTEFVNNLKGELESTFKEDISVYFDINPHDGLLETHEVVESLKEKLKCLIFIPIISRTYCDTKSFAWEHEFAAFVEQASLDQFGLKVKLPNGNVASRVLPVRIYDLDAEDINLCKKLLGSALRGIEFVYSEPGVNRPLKPDDDEKINLKNTRYRNQINKLGNAIKEIIIAARQPQQPSEELTEKPPAGRVSEKKPRISKIIAGLIIGLLIIVPGLIFVPKLFNSSVVLEKSIAVLPFHNESTDQENSAFINGLMEKTTNNLQLIKDFRVVSRTSVEQYRDQNKSISEIARELGVNYIVEGSGQKYGKTFSLNVKLIKAVKKEAQLWGRSFEEEILEVDEILNVQSEIAEAIARELEANITTDEKQLIDKIPTRNLTALDFYLKGKEEYGNYTMKISDKGALDRANNLYIRALEYDSTFAKAYIGLAWIYWEKNYSNEFLTEGFMDSVMMIIDKALSFDSQLSEAYTLRGYYYSKIGKSEEALQEFDKALKYNPNDWEAYLGKGTLYMIYAEEMDKAILNLYKAYAIYKGPELPIVLNYISITYSWAGFMDQARIFSEKLLDLTGDSAAYYSNLGRIEDHLGNYDNASKYWERSYALDTTDMNPPLSLVETYNIMNQKEKSLKYIKKTLNLLKINGTKQVNFMHRIGYGYWINGYTAEAKYYMNEQEKSCYESIRLNRENVSTKYVYYDLAGVNAFNGETEQAINNLKIFNQRTRMPRWVLTLIKNDPLLNNIRHESEFQKIVRDVENKYMAEHERVRKWLEEQGILPTE